MKKIYLALTLLLAGGLCASAQQINGDLNHDGKVDVSDVSCLIGTVLGTQECEYISSQINGDLNHDGLVDVTDLSALISTVLGERSYEYISHSDKTYTINGVSFKMIAVEGGTFKMGATDEQGSDAGATEKPVHSVTLSDYAIGETLVTQALWHAVMGESASPSSSCSWDSIYGLGDNYPVYYASYWECEEFIIKLNSLTGETFRMPKEAEWEYAARGGAKSQGYKYAGSNSFDDVAWCYSNSGSTIHPVATKAANELGLYDMSGNVYEWCADIYGKYTSAAQTNPIGPLSGTSHVIRGGCFDMNGGFTRVSARNSATPEPGSQYIGFRLAK